MRQKSHSNWETVVKQKLNSLLPQNQEEGSATGGPERQRAATQGLTVSARAFWDFSHPPREWEL